MKKLVVLVTFITLLSAQTNKMTGILWADNKIAYEATSDSLGKSVLGVNTVSQKSPFLAGLFSLVVPGSGQFYNGDYWKTAICLVAEGLLLYYKLDNDKKGDDQTDFFENYAKKNWDPAKYAKWTINKFKIDVTKYPDLFTDEQQTVIRNWKTLNKLEDDISKTDAGKYYSHHLAPYGDQQYFEMIGKYPQFNVGWNDFNYNDDFNYGQSLTPMFNYYSGERGKANDYYNKANTFMTILIVNHIVSAAEAFFSAKINNKRVSISSVYDEQKLGTQRIRYSGLNIKFNF